MSWLRDTFPEPGNDSIKVERIRYACSYIFEIIGTDELSWGSVVLATLYRDMSEATKLNKAKIGG
ncbi:hypothetical protein Gotri_025898 [Gossypium trilobum]|uniref:Uncharacterized protein n=1 Tax=Gossypium trilobum TaxID=34281 RepID=A0A7J9FJA7_9ROSI|nr:hypothetical protein [Gossypium trilobum]